MGIVIIASQNKNKIKEINAILEKYELKAVPRDELGLPKDEVEETGETFEENSLLKAVAIKEMIDADDRFEELRTCPIIADDTGLMVDALDGAPGVYSARYAGEDCTYKDNYIKLLGALEGVPAEKRGACFETVITMLYPDGGRLIARGQCHGYITEEALGEGGFGYDPVFRPEGYAETFAQLPAEVKNSISHRAAALAEMERQLAE